MQKLDQKLDSREVAEMVGKEHKELLRDIRRYSEQLGESNIALTDFFTESTYRTEQNKVMPCYLVTKKGCEFIAHKLTGIKGTEFTAKYINRFHEMEEVITAANLSPELQMFQSIFNAVAKNEMESKKALEQSQYALEKVESIREVVSLDTTSWRKDTQTIINKIALSLGGGQAYQSIREESYKLLNSRLGVDVATRLTNLRRRMAENGVSKSKRDKMSYLDVIERDKKLIEGYTAIVKEMAIKYGVA
ncbi:MAG: Rha family transcriptional regulator [Lachnospiraceae bacterium]